MLLYAISSGRGDAGATVRAAAAAFEAGVDWFQIREKCLSAKALYELVRRVTGIRPRAGRVLVNTRADIALAAGADGVHLPANSPAPGGLRRIAPAGFQIGVSCHCAAEVAEAGRHGADYALFGPVFDTPSKRPFGPPQGLERLAEVCRQAPLPVLALGGIGTTQAQQCLAAGAAGVAAIRLFEPNPGLAARVQALRREPNR